MPINFLKLLQDSANFMRNQSQFTLFGVVLLTAMSLANVYLLPQIQFGSRDINALEKVMGEQLPSILFSGFISIFLNVLLVLNIKSINKGNYQHFFQNMGNAVKVLFPALILMILQGLPVGMAFSFLGGRLAQGSGVDIFSLIVVMLGGYIFIKICLVLYVYLMDEPQKKVGESIKFMWALSRGKMRLLFLYCVLNYVVASFLIGLVSLVMSGDIGIFVSQLFSAVLNLFFIIFSFRFYQALRTLSTN